MHKPSNWGDEPDLPTDEAYVFPHPQWTVGVVLIFALVTLFLGIFAHPVWLLIGSPFILAFGLWIVVRFVQWRRGPEARGDQVDLPAAYPESKSQQED